MSPVCLTWPSETLEVDKQNNKGTVLGWGRTTQEKLTANEVIYARKNVEWK